MDYSVFITARSDQGSVQFNTRPFQSILTASVCAGVDGYKSY